MGSGLGVGVRVRVRVRVRVASATSASPALSRMLAARSRAWEEVGGAVQRPGEAHLVRVKVSVRGRVRV